MKRRQMYVVLNLDGEPVIACPNRKWAEEYRLPVESCVILYTRRRRTTLARMHQEIRAKLKRTAVTVSGSDNG